MTPVDQISLLMSEIGPQCNLAEVTEFRDDDTHSWILVVDEDTAVTVDLDDEIGKLVLSVDVATAPAKKRHAVYELLLRFQHSWPETGGLRFSLAQDDQVVISFDLPASKVSLELLQTVVNNFVEQLLRWREIVSEGVRPDESVEDAAPSSAAVTYV